MSGDVDKARLAKLLGMIGSAQDGEALNAARLAHRLVHNAGRTWADVLSGAPRVVHVRVPTALDPDTLATDILASGYEMNERESDFVHDMLSKTRFTPSQLRWLKMIAVKAGVI